MAAELQESYNTGDDSNVSIDTTHWDAQTFQAGSAYDLASVKLLLYRHASWSPGTVTVSIRAVSGTPQTSVPTGDDLESGTTDGSTLTTNTAGEWREITLDSPLSLTSGTYYAIVVICQDVGHFALKWRGKSTGAYADGNRASSGDGSSWTASSRDNMFETWGEGPIEEGTKTVTVAAVVSLSTDLIVRVEGIKTVTVVAIVSLASENYVDLQGFPTPRPSDLDPDLYWGETNGVWSSTRTIHPGNWVQNVLAISEQGEIYFRTV